MKYHVLKAFLVLSMLACASAAFAYDIDSTGTAIGGGTFKPSNNVIVKCTATSTAYGAGSKHKSGDKEYATNNTDSRIYYKTATVGTADPTFGTSATATPGTDWTAL